MDAAKNAIQNFTSKRGHHTDVDEVVNPAVTRETVKPHRHEEVTQAVDREVHQHHYHTTVQPVTHQEVLPEKHHHNIVPVENREFRHDNEGETKQRVAAELAQFKNTSTTHQTHTTQAAAPTVTGEHVHHHVHETVQPIVHKEVIRPEVVHTTIPVHETHHASAEHHGMSALPMKTLDEFTRGGGILHGNKSSTHEEYDGQPRPYNSELQTDMQKLGLAGHRHHGQTDSGVGGLEGNSRHTGSGVGGLEGNSRHTGSGVGGLEGNSRNTGSGVGGLDNSTSRQSGTGLDNSTSSNSRQHGNDNYENESGRMGTTDTTQTKKPSLLQRLNPKTDTTGDGKPGIMS